ncbi:MAG: hypothetical protein FWE32_03065 [Oscillospiraceae bacterium]|nr:hypothetical protein [Oscillospiraceae bacterium]
MDILNNRVVAGLLCVVMVVASSVVGGGATLGSLRGQTAAIFTLGQSGAPGIQSDLNEIAAQSFNVTVIAGRYLQEDYTGIVQVLNSRDALLSAAGPREKHRAAGELVAATNMLRTTLDGLDLSAQDQNLLASCVVEINSRLMLIAGSGYNQSALYFNHTLERFPANILGRAARVSPLELYE